MEKKLTKAIVVAGILALIASPVNADQGGLWAQFFAAQNEGGGAAHQGQDRVFLCFSMQGPKNTKKDCYALARVPSTDKAVIEGMSVEDQSLQKSIDPPKDFDVSFFRKISFEDRDLLLSEINLWNAGNYKFTEDNLKNLVGHILALSGFRVPPREAAKSEYDYVKATSGLAEVSPPSGR